MLDLMTLGASMGLQTELNKVREETGAPVHQEEPVEEQTSTPLSQAAGVVADALTVVEETVVAAASSLIPSSEMVAGMMENVSLQAPTVDLSLPTQSQSVAKK